ncbi:hypothetical protein [Saccharopolyspora erythraea]|uniref:hypothetical protein n=1 Tax=Saccharopolyspora erythraea TaxID=1836 RepID=UPI001BA843CC|nr:hypothetical protein [Saccharopolyspora erythraea]
MGAEERDEETVTLWRPTRQNELDLVASSGWHAWPPWRPEQPVFYSVLDRWYATKITRESNVPREGVGYVTRFDVRKSFLDRCTVQHVGGCDVRGYGIPAEDSEDLNSNIVGAITEEADYRGSVADEEFAAAAGALGSPLPAAWCDYLRGRSWFRRGWLSSDCYVWLYTPRETVEMDAVLRDTGADEAFPRAVVLGGDGSRELLTVDLRHDPAPVMLVDLTTSGWQDARPQADDIARFIERIESGTFAYA